MGTFSKVAQVLKIMQSDYAEKLDVEQLADMAHMSTSAFHRAFKNITSDSPMQYLKKIRLTKARDFMNKKKPHGRKTCHNEKLLLLKNGRFIRNVYRIGSGVIIPTNR